MTLARTIIWGLAAAASAATAQPVPQEDIVWMGSLPRRPLANEDVVLTAPKGGEPRLSLRVRQDGVEPAPPMPIAVDLLSRTKADAFGVDGRCRVAHAGTDVTMDCAAGQSISGVVLGFGDVRLPRKAALHLAVTASGSSGFAAELVRAGAEAYAPRPLASGAASLPLPALEGSVQLVIVAPEAGGRITISDLRLAPAVEARAVDTAAWSWAPDLWAQNPAALIASARARGLKRLFVSLEIADGTVRQAAKLRRFVKAAAAQGIAVDAVEGDPRMVLPAGRTSALARATAIAAYQRAAGAGERLAGIQYDIEPYILPEWGEMGPASYRGWEETVRLLSGHLGEPVDLVLPFWITNDDRARAMLDRLTDSVRSITVMSYRTEAEVLSQIAEPLLAWGAANGKPVRLGLEAGPIADETEQVFAASVSGTIAVFPGEAPRVVLLQEEQTVPGATMFAQRSRVSIPGSRISFQGREQAMRAMADATRPIFSAWPSFAGFAFHGLDWSAPKR